MGVWKKYSSLLVFLCFAATIILLILLWPMMPFQTGIKIVILIIIALPLFYVIFFFSDNICYVFQRINLFTFLIVLFTVFLLFPLLLNSKFGIEKEKVLSKFPADNLVYFKVTCKTHYIESSGNIGNEVSFKHYLNSDTKFRSGDILVANVNDTFTITSVVSENDEGYGDLGKKKSEELSFINNDDYLRNLALSQNVRITEHNGRTAGSYSEYEFKYKIERVLPTKSSLFNVIYSNKNPSSRAYSTMLIVGWILSGLFVIFVLLYGRKRKEIIEENARIQRKIAKEKELAEIEYEQKQREIAMERERAEKQKIFLAEKQAFIDSLNGESIREIAGVPDNIKIINGYPVDNDDSRYGSYTVFYTSSGKCYHTKKGCCSAFSPMHCFDAINLLQPCSKCCSKTITIPEWYSEYMRLRSKARYYGIHCD